MANFSGKLSYNDGNVVAGSAPLLPPPAADCRQDPFVAASHNSQLDGALKQLDIFEMWNFRKSEFELLTLAGMSDTSLWCM